jgi:apoptosis-inducing factor 2
MARAAWMQSKIVLKNILASLKGKQPTATYRPNRGIEGAIKLTLGLVSSSGIYRRTLILNVS